MKKVKVLFVCMMNRMRSRTAEDLYKNQPDLEVRSAGIDPEAEQVVTLEMLKWADVIFCFELGQMHTLKKMAYGKKLNIVCLGIPDKYFYGDRALIAILKQRLTRKLGEVVTTPYMLNAMDARAYRMIKFNDFKKVA